MAKILMFHPNGDIHGYDLNDKESVRDLVSDIDFELHEGGAEVLGICKADLSKDKQDIIGDRLSYRLDPSPR